MKSIRIGKDIEVHWPILTNGQEVSLEGRDLTLFARLPTWVEMLIEFTVEENIVTFDIPGKDQRITGAYSFTLWENYGKEGQTAVDYCQAFQLVETTCMEGGEDKGLATETIELESSNIVMGIPGPKGDPGEQGDKGDKGDIGRSAYELFKEYNPNSTLTEKEYADAPIDAAARAYEAAKAATPIIINVEGTDVVIDVLANRKYVCGELKSLTIASAEYSAYEATIWFRSGTTETQLTMPNDLYSKVIGYTKPAPNTNYEINIANGIPVIANTH